MPAASSSQSTGDHRDSVDTVMMTVKGFAGEPEALYVALDYTYHNDVTITMAPATEHDSGPTFG
jgi:hypothetical protein